MHRGLWPQACCRSLRAERAGESPSLGKGEEAAPADVRKLEGALHHAPGRVAVVRQDARAEGAVVGADAHRPVQALALLHQRREGLRGSKAPVSAGVRARGPLSLWIGGQRCIVA